MRIDQKSAKCLNEALEAPLEFVDQDYSVPDYSIPVIAIDGMSGAGKGTARHNVAKRLGWHELDSGLLYRSVGYLCCLEEVDISREEKVVAIAETLSSRVEMKDGVVCIDGVECTKVLRSKIVDGNSALVAQIRKVRQAILKIQLAARRMPGLVADGRDMGEIYDATHKFFLLAQVEVVAARRVKQLQDMGLFASYEEVLRDLKARNEADRNRILSPALPHMNARIIDTTDLNEEAVAELILYYVHKETNGGVLVS